MDQGFAGIECVGRPWGRIVRAMVSGMQLPKQRNTMHEPMHPVEIGILRDDHRYHASNEIKPPMERNVCVNRKQAVRRPDPDRSPNGRKDADGYERVADFPPDLTDGRNAGANLSVSQS